jgi:Animal haem peroxidase
MVTHGSESYFVIGEGLLGEAVGGRNGGPPDGGAAVAATAASATAAAASVPPFRFSRMGPSGVGRQLGEPNRKKVGAAMAEPGGGQSHIPAGFTYLGQFLDHDLTFDKTNVMLGANVTPAQLLQARSPSLDLDSLYGAGPGDPESAKFYEADGLHLKRGKSIFPTKNGFDLPRGAGNTAAKKRKAIIPDPRNDENLAVAQTHTAMIRFHNRVVDTQLGSVPPAQKFDKAREIVTKHYQWMIRSDYLPRICQPGVVNDVFNNGRKAFEVGATPTDVPTMPIEFSVAAFRLGHSMVRPHYNWNKNFPSGQGTLPLLFEFSATGGTLGGEARLLTIWVADFRRLYDFGEAGRADLVVSADKFNRAMRIDSLIANPLQHLPPQTVALPNSTPGTDVRRNLAFRNLTRARMVKLATGQQMANFLKSKGVNLTKLTKAQIREGNGGADLASLTQTQRQAVLRDTPLWLYVLREAELNNGRLKGVGARIVAETFHRAIEGSTHSIVRDTTFAPTLGPNSSTFRMVDLLLFAFEGKKTLLNPNG